jgi:hypothetical protein
MDVLRKRSHLKVYELSIVQGVVIMGLQETSGVMYLKEQRTVAGRGRLCCSFKSAIN